MNESGVCVACKAGWFGDGMSGCEMCPGGTFSDVGSGNCGACPIGQFTAAGSGDCVNCSVGTGGPFCLKCEVIDGKCT